MTSPRSACSTRRRSGAGTARATTDAARGAGDGRGGVYCLVEGAAADELAPGAPASAIWVAAAARV